MLMMSCHSWKTGYGYGWSPPIGRERMLELHNPSLTVYRRGSIVFVTVKYDQQSLLVAGEGLEGKASRNLNILLPKGKRWSTSHKNSNL